MSNDQQEERWHVQLDSREVLVMTLEQLDEAFQQGLVHERTYVVQVGSSSWQTLGEVAGLGSEADAPAEAVAAASQGLPQATAQRPVARPAAVGGWPPVAVSPGFSVATSSLPPSSGSLQATRSVIPVVQDVIPAHDFSSTDFKPRKTKLLVGMGIGVSAIAAGVFGLIQLDAPPTSEAQAFPAAPMVAAAAAAPTTPSSDPATTPTESPIPAARTASQNTAGSEDKQAAPGTALSEDTKKALLAKDSGRISSRKHRSRSTSNHTARRSSRSQTSSGPIRGGGNQHDPLNGNL